MLTIDIPLPQLETTMNLATKFYQDQQSGGSTKSNLGNKHEYSSIGLFGKVWGDQIPVATIATKTKNDWKGVKGTIEYIELSNGWIFFRFANEADRDYVWRERPLFIQGLNLLLQPWEPFFDSLKLTSLLWTNG